jgi:DNA-binding transcriptional LysR family regulator
MYDWDDLRIFLSVARHKSFQGAADQLGLDPTTIGRRMARLEQALNCTLVARGRSPGFLTTNGKRLFEAASRVEMATEDVRTAIGETSAGVVRISTSEGFGATIIAPAVAQLVRRRPKLQIEIVAMPGFVSPAMREVDITITLTRPQDRRLSIEKLTDYMLGLYAAPDYLARRGVPEDPAALRGHVLVGYIDDLLYANELRYLDEVLPGLKPTVSSSSIRAQMEAMIRGAGSGCSAVLHGGAGARTGAHSAGPGCHHPHLLACRAARRAGNRARAPGDELDSRYGGGGAPASAAGCGQPSDLTISSVIFFASPNSIIVLSRKKSSFSIPA